MKANTKKGLIIAGGVGTGLLLLLGSGSQEGELAIGGGGSFLTGLRESAGGFTKTVTTTEETIGSDTPFELPAITEKKAVSIPNTSKSSSSGTSIKGGVEFRNSSGKLIGVEDSTADNGRGQSRLPTPIESSFNRAFIPTKKTSLRAPTPAPKTERKNPFSGWFK
jgi:hypothetical protein